MPPVHTLCRGRFFSDDPRSHSAIWRLFCVKFKRVHLATMTYRLSLLLLTALLVSYGCRTTKPANTDRPITATITEEGLLNCFLPGTSLNGQSVWCEASAVLFDGTSILVANDKDMPAGQSPVFMKAPTTLADSTQRPVYLTQRAFSAARKYEDFSQTPDGQFSLLITAFDRIKTDSHDWDGYNTLLYWRKGDTDHPHVLAPDDTSRTSISYRQPIARLLATDQFPGGVPYFKIEGLAATDKHLLFGIREAGQSYEHFTYQAKVISVSYRVEKTRGTDRIRLNDDWRIINDFSIAKADSTLPKPLALSSLEYDPLRNRFWLLTSLETPDKLDGYLWTISPSDLFANKPFTLVRDEQGKPLHFNHKAEDITPLDDQRLLIIHDDDRVRTRVGSRTRQPHQAAYTIVRVR